MTAPARAPRSWRHWPLLVKLIAVLMVPTVVALVVGVLRIVDQSSAAPGYDRINEVAGVQRELSALVGELQRERDAAAVYVTDDRGGDVASLRQQFAAGDAAATRVRQAATGIGHLRDTGYTAAMGSLDGLSPLRQSVVSGSGPSDVVIAEYSAAIEPLITLDAALTRELDDVAVAGQAAARHALVSAREQVAQQHSLLLPALISDQLDAATLEAVRAANVRLQSQLDTLRSSLPPAQQARYVDPVTAAPEEGRQRILAQVLDRGQSDEPLATPVDDWDARTAATTSEMLQSENALHEEVSATAISLRDDARSTAGWNAVLLFFALAFGVALGIVIARSIVRPLGVLRGAAFEVAGRRLPQAVATVREGGTPQAVQPVPVHTRDEIGQVARAFDEVHSQAVRLAVEQAQLRSNVNDIFVNLSRRSQSLVQRQLKLIDRLEATEQDPETLDNLFQLDHLATRMRRNSENLLVLAGTESTKRAARPTSLVDVLRAAVSEVEQYQRLVLEPPPDVLVSGRAASDLVHLVAELLDNATHFSPPESQVMISARSAHDDSLVIEIDDRGVGMGETELAGTNERLATSATVDPSVSRRMGLFVVGRLAARHGIAVTLSAGEDGVGVTASINLPPGLVRSADDAGHGQEAQAVDAATAGGEEMAHGSGADNGALPRRASSPPGSGAVTPATTVNSWAAANGNAADVATGTPGPRSVGDWSPAVSARHASGSELPRRGGESRVPPGPAPTPPRPPAAGSHSVTGSSTGSDLFQSSSGQAAEQQPEASQRPSRRVDLEQATPIFDDVASAWFSENRQVPGRWSPPGSAQAGGEQDSERPGQVTWGSADEGWQAAAALAQPSERDLTAAGLPRREPRAQLVPGAAEAAAPASGGAPSRSAEAIGGRLASYQRGVREGRQGRHGAESEDDGPSPRHGTGEETQ
ncbi:MAG: HAMP domain-containing protein [Pseudonocardiaceae bacterium]|nr:HAMP domain-containing protein [Pseudonocardiaceae bacterium]